MSNIRKILMPTYKRIRFYNKIEHKIYWRKNSSSLLMNSLACIIS
jgi:hypothetical protein